MRDRTSGYRLLLLGTLLGLFLRLLIAWQPVNEIGWRITADDAYYYFKLAQNLGAGLGATVDGIHPTNGFHPLYAGLLVPIFVFARTNLELGVHLALTLVAVVNTATVWPIYLIGKRVRSRQTGMIGALLYVLNPWAIILTMTGVESAVYLFTYAWAVVGYLAWRAQPSVRRALLAGGLVGLTIMARSEGGVLLIGIVADLLIRGRRQTRASVIAGMIICVAAGLVCLPWALWSSVRFGTPLQVSAAAIMLHTHVDRPQGLVEQIGWYLRRTSWFVPRYAYKILLFNLPVTILAGLLAWRVRHERSQARHYLRAALPLSFLVIPFVLVSGYYNLVLWHQQHWYFNSLVLNITLLAAPVFGAWLDNQERSSAWSIALVKLSTTGIAILCVGMLGIMWIRGLYPKQRLSYEVSHWIAQDPLRFAVFGSTDSGAIGYYCGCPMVNLDGVMNNSAYQYYRMHGYRHKVVGAYAVSVGVAYMLLPLDVGEFPFEGSLHLNRERIIEGTGAALYRVSP